MTQSRYGNCNAVDVIEMPLAFSISIQSDTVERRPALPWMAPASVITRACRASASVSVDLPASGWLITAKVRRRCASAAMRAVARSPPPVVVGEAASRAESVMSEEMVWPTRCRSVIEPRAAPRERVLTCTDTPG